MPIALSKPKCPKCHEQAVGMIESMQLLVKFDWTDLGLDYSGETKPFTDTQRPIQNGNGQSLLQCELGHEWYSDVREY